MNSNTRSKKISINQALQLVVVSLVAALGMSACGSSGGGSTPAAPATPTLTVAAGSVVEGTTGATTTVDFTVSLSAVASSDVSVTYSTADNTATTADLDYIASSGATLVIPAGSLSGVISITVTGDDDIELDENFNLLINSAPGATIASGSESVVGAILSDDSLAAYYTSTGTTTVNEGNGTLDILAGQIQVIADANRLAIINLTNDLVYIADISAINATPVFNANARIYKGGNYTGDNASISGVINLDANQTITSLDLTFTADSVNAGGNGW